jgi:protein phosphatase
MYLVRAGSIYRLTEDHSLAAALVRDKVISAEAAHRHMGRKVILRALGTEQDIEVDCWERPLPVRVGDRFVLCTDGLHDLVADDEICAAVVAGDPADACDVLVSLAKERGGHDNITVAVLIVLSDTPVSPETRADQNVGRSST